jgi:glycosyltransferase involved in cell wall biosynthesis
MEKKMRLNLSGVNMRGDFGKQDMGYPLASTNMTNAFANNDVDVTVFDPTSRINLSYAVPDNHVLFSGAYNILYSCHETSEISDRWAECISKGDELWTASSWAADVFRKKYDGNINVFPHGVSGKFIPAKRRLQDDKFFFLHTGEPYVRKGGQIAVEAFLEEFADDDNVFLILKTYDQGHTIQVDDGTGKLVSPEVAYKNIKTIKKSVSFNDYLRILHNTHCFIYPSWGEGFGMMPLEAMATGMPAITTCEWAEYKDDVKFKIDSDIVPVPDRIPSYLKETYLGNVYMPRKESLKSQMRMVYNNHLNEFEDSFEKSISIHKRWNWDTLAEKYAIPRLKEIYGELNV